MLTHLLQAVYNQSMFDFIMDMDISAGDREYLVDGKRE